MTLSADARAVASGIARALAPPEAGDEPPGWLRPHQLPSFRRAVAAVRAHRGALLADPVGSGKTYVALAVAGCLDPASTIDAVVPAILRDQWTRAAASLGLPIRVLSHELVSRGMVPDGGSFVLIDESHRFRNPGTKRYSAIAPALIGRRGLLVSATPVINRLEDLAHQLLLLVRDDALRIAGVDSLRAALCHGQCPHALAALMVTTGPLEGELPARIELLVPGQELESPELRDVLERLDRLRLSREAPVAALIRSILLWATASSPAALLATLRRYQRLLAHAGDARRAGRRLTRGDLLRAIHGREDQLVWWELLEGSGEPAELPLTDREELRRLIRRVSRWADRGDAKVERLTALLAQPEPTLVFCTAVETVGWLRRRLGIPRLAWCTGSAAGFGHQRAAQSAVLRCFAPGEPVSAGVLAPRVLLATDLAAEGLNLQRVKRVVHYDLPWTAVRLEQRDGRALRLGAEHRAVQVVRFEIPPAVEARLRLMDRLDRKAALHGQAGLGPAAEPQWRWRRELAARFAGAEAAEGWGAIGASRSGVVAAIELSALSGEIVSTVLARDGDGKWGDAPELIEALLEAALQGEPVSGSDALTLDRALDGLDLAVGRLVSVASGRAWLPPEPSAAGRLAARRLRQEASTAARDRDRRKLALLDQALAFLRRGHTAGERLLLERLAAGDAKALATILRVLPREAAEPGPVRARMVGLLVLEGPD